MIINVKNVFLKMNVKYVMLQKIFYQKKIVVVKMAIILIVKIYNVINAWNFVKYVMKKIIVYNVIMNIYVLRMVKIVMVKFKL